MKPKITALLCTYNNQSDVKRCLDSILRQKEKSFEVLCIDGGSTDGTRELVKSYSRKDKRVVLVNNPNRLPEGRGNGKWFGFRKAKGNIVAIIDQDNVLQRSSVFSEAIATLEAEPQAFGALGALTHSKKDSPVVRYVSLVGTDSFFAYRSVDFLRNFRRIIKRRIGIYEYGVLIFSDKGWITGGNCFFYRKSDIESIGGYDRDIIAVSQLAKEKSKLVIIPDATKHYAESSLTKLAAKKLRWGKSYFSSKEKNFSYLKNSRDKILFFLNLLACVTIIPYLLFSMLLYTKKKDPVILLFPIHAFLTATAYAISAFRRLFD